MIPEDTVISVRVLAAATRLPPAVLDVKVEALAGAAFFAL